MKKQSLLKSSQRIAEWLQMCHKFVQPGNTLLLLIGF
ncbi:Uncharacterised protein [Escherichia coli]|uniref:Uncharacterized protein n=1 Tax=Escherichia coli TaxID=562 RepID=A0A377AR21_ECOLX|nr:Uncharacterised protein [Escherichia coli]